MSNGTLDIAHLVLLNCSDINGQFENAAANLIQVRWRQYVYEKSLKDPFSHLKQGCCNDIER